MDETDQMHWLGQAMRIADMYSYKFKYNNRPTFQMEHPSSGKTKVESYKQR